MKIYGFNEDLRIRPVDTVLVNPNTTDQVGRLSGIGSTLFASKRMFQQSIDDVDYDNRIIFDASLYTDAVGLTGILDNIPEEDMDIELAYIADNLFSILQHIKLGHAESNATLNSELLAAFPGDGTGNGAYVADSIARSVSTTSVRLITAPATEQVVSLYDWMEFGTVIMGAPQTFRIYIKESLFVTEYPYTVFGPVLCPISPLILAGLYKNEITVSLSTLVNANLVDQIHTNDYLKDYTGVYVSNSYFGDTGVELKFGIYYNGKTPNPDQANAAVAAYISSVAESTAFWINVLPDIFTTEAFFYIPMWDNYLMVGENTVKLYPSICPIFTALEDAHAVFAAVDQEFVDANIQVTQASGPEIYLTVVPAYGNSKQQLSEIYPDYTRDTAPTNALPYVSANTKEFMALLSTYLNTARIATSTVNIQSKFGYSWYTFSHSGAVHYILKSSEYAAVRASV